MKVIVMISCMNSLYGYIIQRKGDSGHINYYNRLHVIYLLITQCTCNVEIVISIVLLCTCTL